MITRKKLLSQLRLKKAEEERKQNIDKFVRHILKLRGAKLYTHPQYECFRGFQVWVEGIQKVGGCPVASIKGCTQCRNAVTAFDKAIKGQPTNFQCRNQDPKNGFHVDLVWIIMPDEISMKALENKHYKIPGSFTVPRVKQQFDAHGHAIEELEIPRIRQPRIDPPVEMQLRNIEENLPIIERPPR